MTDKLAALACLVSTPPPSTIREAALTSFLTEAGDNALVINKWFAIQASADYETVFEDIQQLRNHPLFILSNPNRVRSLLSVFSGVNLYHFHRSDGKGYEFMVDNIIALDRMNPQVAARMISCFALWRKFDIKRRNFMEVALQRIQNTEKLSPDSYEVVSRYLK
jgi:aminopeptidase N